MFKYLTNPRAVLEEKWTDEKLRSAALAIKVASTLLDLVFWIVFFASFTLHSYVNYAIVVVFSYLIIYKKIGRLSVNWLIWHELTKEEKLQLQKEDYYSIVRQMLEHNLDCAVFVAHVEQLKEQENKEIELKNKEEILEYTNGAGYENMLQTFNQYLKFHAIYMKCTTLFFISLNALLFTYCFNGADYAVANTPFAQLSMMNLILSLMGVLMLFSALTYLMQFYHSPDDAPASCAQDYYLAEFIRVVSMYKKEFEAFKAQKCRCLSVADMLEFKEKVVRD